MGVPLPGAAHRAGAARSAGAALRDPGDWTGQLTLRIATRPAPAAPNGQRAVAVEQFHEGALRVLRPHYLDESGQVSYTLVNPGGGYLGGDSYLVDVEVADGAAALLTTQSATKVYRTPQGPARQHTRLRLRAGARLEYVPDQLIVYRDGAYRQTTEVLMAPDASLVTSEIITPGWSPTGEPFGWDLLTARCDVRVDTPTGPRRLLLDHLRLDPRRDLTGIGILEGHTHTGTLLVIDPLIDAPLTQRLHDITAATAPASGIAQLHSAPGLPAGLLVRSLGTSTSDIARLHTCLLNEVRARLHDQGPLNLRKY
ncbi:urease accessory protein UreD [Corynebacterium uberis]|uniref:urease accessory protein UreD n=1 Tax=Corynebacterium TaxID=1716 RepID=UPI001D0A9306|nr:urease accessory protein UreD [Corynebacterium uberis]MCZ9309505.1 urease accessory protein UreD [Corynebacterium sp. c6VSa_13]UDL73053.1 urease accessory protein UreD [Corynebacterium uberis]UDL76070.1 urease accessory protein UreD [Corynebacterium uberis]UDL78282.1 urease accessory protein UreD [Corynebacterium uberis]UDL80565.1 urease accessory protein UreD [Corynebacterium uberis]